MHVNVNNSAFAKRLVGSLTAISLWIGGTGCGGLNTTTTATTGTVYWAGTISGAASNGIFATNLSTGLTTLVETLTPTDVSYLGVSKDGSTLMIGVRSSTGTTFATCSTSGGTITTVGNIGGFSQNMDVDPARINVAYATTSSLTSSLVSAPINGAASSTFGVSALASANLGLLYTTSKGIIFTGGTASTPTIMNMLPNLGSTASTPTTLVPTGQAPFAISSDETKFFYTHPDTTTSFSLHSINLTSNVDTTICPLTSSGTVTSMELSADASSIYFVQNGTTPQAVNLSTSVVTPLALGALTVNAIGRIQR